MLNVVLDTNHWIGLKYSKESREKLRRSKNKHGFRIIFTRPNFVDLAKAKEQDELSGIISEFADLYVFVNDYYEDEYIQAQTPIGLIRPEDRDELERQTEDFGTEKTLRYLFRFYDQDPDPGYGEISHSLRELYDKGGNTLLETATFWTYAEQVDEDVRVDFTEASTTGYVRRMLKAEHAKQLKPNENVEPQDYFDIELCAYAIYASDVFVGEDKWINKTDIIPAVCEDLENESGPVLLHPFDELFDAFPIS